ncbi:Bromodomain containing protein [Histomonas meleagridis]|uniref:Bromodomain containing protein n=1 Tax=Histomonas meleagridis TaxID=135588 RepID=UPI00355988BC|nr:Bromodomain containing protein [Histomonas meleagridis]KAH0806194.1 Bromodomain containing protein [Histomonas meleagridis]
MSTSVMRRCREITEKLMEKPINSYFMHPVNPVKEGLTGYDDIIEKKMDLSTILNKIKANEYGSAREWYQDVLLVYENALKYHDPSTIWYAIAKYGLKQFQSEAIGMECETPQEWYDLVGKTMRKLSENISNGPVPQGVDPLVLSIVKKADTMPPPSSQTIAELVEKLNSQIGDDNIHFDVLCILKETQPSLKIEGESMTIDADKLSPLSLNALSLYVKAQ